MVVVIALVLAAQAQQNGGTLKGTVTDSSGAVIPGVKVSVTAGGVERTATTDQAGSYTLLGLPPATYAVRATAAGFGSFRGRTDVAAGRVATLNVILQVAVEKQEVTVAAEGAPAVSTEASNNAGALVLRGEDLDALPDDPDDLQDDLQALAGPSAGPSGGEIYVDGFSNARLPPKASIREIRINQNPFSSEYDRLGYGRIEILTKPGTDNFHGQLMFNDSDEVFNARNPYASNKPDFQSQQFGGNVTGPLSKRASFFMDFERRDITDNALINASIPTLTQRPEEAIVTPTERTTLSPRLDYQLTSKQTIVARYSYMRFNQTDAGLASPTYLPDQAYPSLTTEQTVQLTDTIVLSSRTVNETRFQFARDTSDLNANDNTYTIEAPEFVSGGAPTGHSTQDEKHYELQNFTTMAVGAHGLKFGLRVRGLTLDNSTLSNEAGTFVFTSLTQYLAAQEAPPGQGIAAQFLISSGTPLASISRVDVAPLFQDDWRVRPNLTVSLGLRYETQTNIHDWHDIAPRLGFAWAPGGGPKGNGKTVIRGGFGIFYDRFDESLTLNADRFNGVNQQSYVVLNPTFYPNIPPLSSLAPYEQATIYQVQPGLRAPRTMQSALGVERQLPWNTTVASMITYSKGEHLLRTVNINSPEPGTEPGTFVYPNGTKEVIDQYQANGAFRQEQWITNVNSRLNKNISFFAFYVLSKAMSDTDGVGTFPASAYDLSEEWGRSSLDVRNRFVLGGSIMTRWGIRLSPFIIARSGAPFNITTGTDLNGDTIFADRPAFYTPGQNGEPAVIPANEKMTTPWGTFYLDPAPGTPVIPRNYGQSPGYFGINLRLSKVFGFGEARSAPGMSISGGGPGGPGGGPRGGGPMGMGGRGGGMRGVFSDALTDHRFNLTFSISARNLLNSTNPGPVVGNLSSAFFGQSLVMASPFGGGVAAGTASAADNRRVELGLRFNF
jgi:hypothetical protein